MKYFLIFFLFFNYFFGKINNVFAEEDNTIDEKIEEIIENNSRKDITKVVEKILKTVVTIEAIKLENVNINNKNSYFIVEKLGNTNEIGTGFLISEDGFVLTNHHVISGSNKIIVKIEDKEYQAEIVGDDCYSDVALLKIKNKNDEVFSFVKLNPEVNIKIGESVIIIGNPYNLGLSVSSGIISALDRSIKNTGYIGLIQTDANINKGNSGGPIFNKNGDIIGINSIVFSPKENRNTGIGFAIPIKNIVDVIDKLKEFGFIQRGWLGIKGEDTTEDIFKILNSKRGTGILVKNVIEGSPADKSGILPSDIIISYNDKHIKDLNNLIYMIRNTNINSNVSILILRAGKYIKLKANIKELPVNLDEVYEQILNNTVDFMDMNITQFDRNLIDRYKLHDGFEDKAMYVLYVKNGGIADKNGIKAGDLILSINQVQLKNKIILNNLINSLKKNNQQNIILTVKKVVSGDVVILKVNLNNYI